MIDKISSHIIGLGYYAPKNVIDNSYFSKFMDTSNQWIQDRTGIKERRFVERGQGPSDIAIPAIEMALKDADLSFFL